MKRLRIFYITALAVILSLSTVLAQDVTLVQEENQWKELRLEDAIAQAQKRSRLLKMQQRQIDYAKADTEDAYYNYLSGSDYVFEVVSTNYSLARVNEDYETKQESVVAEQIAYDIEMKFDSILELEEKYILATKSLNLQEQKTRQAVRKEQLGLDSKANVTAQKAILETQKKEIAMLEQSMDAEYRKLNDAIGGKEDRYHLIKENIYTPLEMKRSLEGHISYSISSDPNLWKQEESAKLQERIITANTANGAPTYAEYQKRKINYEQGMSAVAQSKENRELQVKDTYEKIIQLEIQYNKDLIDLEEAQRQLQIVEKQYELGMVPRIQLEEVELGVMNIKTQINSRIRQHNQLKTIFEKSYLAAGM